MSGMMEAVADASEERLIERLERLVGTNTVNPPGDEIKTAAYLADCLRAAGFETEVDEFLPGRANVVARLENGPGPCIAFNTHMDVVPPGDGWSGDPFTLRRQGARLVGRGACDAKGPLVALLEAAELLASTRSAWSGSLLVVFVADEEIGSKGARLFASKRPKIDYCIVGEPTSNRVATAHKGSVRPLVRVRGSAAHSSTPDDGVNAIYAAGRLLEFVESRHRELRERNHPLVGSPSLTVTRVFGGLADNAVPDTCDLLLDRRMIPGEDEQGVMREIEALLRDAKAQSAVDAAVVEYRPTTGGATETNAASPIVAAALAAARKNGQTDDSLFGLSGACDLVHFRSAGAQGVIIGPGSIAMAHKPDEFVGADELVQASRIYRDAVILASRVSLGG